MKKVMLAGKQVTFRTKISNSKKQLARIISENGGWREGAEFAAQDKYHCGFGNVICFYRNNTPWFNGGSFWRGSGVHEDRVRASELVKNWHQTVLARDEYFHLYPAPDAEGWIEWKGGECPCPGASGVARRRDGQEIYFSEGEVRCWSHDKNCMPSLQIVAYRIHRTAETESVKPERIVIEPEPTIEQLAADYRNLRDFAERKQQEANGAKADADARLEKLVAAGKALGLVLSVAAPEPAKPYTGKFYNAKLGEYAIYDDDTNDALCDGCGRRWGQHYEDESYCHPYSERKNA